MRKKNNKLQRWAYLAVAITMGIGSWSLRGGETTPIENVTNKVPSSTKPILPSNPPPAELKTNSFPSQARLPQAMGSEVLFVIPRKHPARMPTNQIRSLKGPNAPRTFKPTAQESLPPRPFPPQGVGRRPFQGAPSLPPPSTQQKATPPAQPSPPSKGGIRLNFQNAPLQEILNYLSEAAGFVIVQEEPVEATVNVISHSPLSPEEVVDLLNTVLVDKGYAVVRIGRILKIVPRDDASKYPVPVRRGLNPEQIPQTDEVITQILPVRYLDATKLVDVLQPLFADSAKVTADEASNSLIITDKAINIRRIAEIINTLDTSISAISTIRVFPLQYADAAQVAQMINQLFQQQSQTGDRQRGPRFFPPFMRSPQGRPQSSTPQSPARAAASRVIAVADERTNSLVVSAPEDLMPTIEALIQQIDREADEPVEVRIFHLQNADAVELASLLTQLFSQAQTSRVGPIRFGFPFGMMRGSSREGSRRAREMETVVAVGDPRTNSLIVSAARDTMVQIAELIGRLDADTSRKQHVYVYKLEHADPDTVAQILQNIFEESGLGRRSYRSRYGRYGSTSNPLQQRSQRGATLNPSFGAGSSSRRPSR